MTVAAVISLENLAIERGGVPLITGLSVSLTPGEALILRGPNGSGKTTLLRTIAGLQNPLEGRVVTDPEAVTYAAHADGIKATLSVTENLAFWAALHGTSELEPAMTAFDLISLADRPAGALSAGQKRRLGLARLLVTGRPVWALDEPTVSLDARSVGLFADAVRGHLATGGVALMATHIDLGLDVTVLNVTDYAAAAGQHMGSVFDEALS